MKRTSLENIKDEELSLNQILESVDAFLYEFEYNDDGEIIEIKFISNNVSKIYDISNEEYRKRVGDRNLSDLFIEEKREAVSEFFHQSLIQGKKGAIRYGVKGKSGIVWVEEKIYPKRNLIAPHTVFGIVQNITSEIIEEQQKQATEKKYQLLFNRNLAGVYRTHVNGEILECNKAFKDILGFETVEELKQHRVQDLYLEEKDREPYIKELREKGFISNCVSILKRKDGRKLILNNNVGIFPDEKGELNIIEGTLVDITQEHEANLSLKQNELKYKLLFEESNIPILLLSFHDGAFYAVQGNKNAHKLFKTKTEGDLMGESLSKYIPQKSSFFTEIYQALLKNNQTKEITKIINLDNEVLEAELFFSYVKVEKQELIQLVIKDVTEFKQGQQLLKKSEQNLKNIVDTSPAGILIFTNDELQYSNPIAKHIIENLLESKGTRLTEIFNKEQTEIFKHLHSQTTNQKNTYLEIDINQQYRYAVTLVHITYNENPSTLISLTDVTLQYEFNAQKLRAELAEETNVLLEKEILQHKKTQEQLREKSSRLHAFIESSANLFIATLDHEFKLTSFNKNFFQEFAHLSGVKPHPGDKLFDLLKTTKRGQRWFKHQLKKTFHGEDQVVVSKFPTSEGKESWFEVFLNPIQINENEIKEISLIAHNITQKIESEKRIKSSESRNRALLQSIPDLIYRVSKDGVFIDFQSNNPLENEIFYEFTKTENIIGKSLHEVFLSTQTADDFLSDVKKAIESEELVKRYFKLKSRRDGKNRTFFYENRYSKTSENEVIVIARNITDSEENEARLRESLKEKEILLKEVHHRVKNNLQVINSILNLQSSYISDPNTIEFINESQNRIRSMSFIHESLYLTENFSSINFYDYITNLVNNLFQSYQSPGERITLELDVKKTHLVLDQAIPCGLILNELLSNALKYAFPDDRKGKIYVKLEESEGKIKIEVSDNGVGFPKGLDLDNLDSLGLNLVEILTEQLDGTLSIETKSGTKFLIIFDKEEA